jgi:hypothetical protein
MSHQSNGSIAMPKPVPAVCSSTGEPAADFPTRTQSDAEPVRLSRRGIALLLATRSKVQLHTTVRNFPHVIDKLADAWDYPQVFVVVINELLFTDRTQRQGFPIEVLNELTALRSLHEQMVFARKAPKPEPAIDADGLRERLKFTGTGGPMLIGNE